ncbi:DUF3027 domain-containing protein [Agrococcus sp. SL85]|uniref:DUF3027 domain-containing protein n=1 Tax=Agrococcus sp. SL85 TaxID=2995141 RepID=UPI00226C6DE4|nr:DUF3027 domain-containing protein [Agrococcus sp. SL85]WAC66529.1 DUF3027 domain-containing protein [Agrococcus sp. SL85]
MTSTPDAREDDAQASPATAVPVTPTAQELALALAALDEIAPRGAVGDVVDAVAEGDGVVAVRHASTLSGYPDWTWTVLLSRDVEGGPTVLEAALLPGEGSLLAPAWTPWADRMAEYLAAKDAASADGDDDELDDHDELESDLDADLEDDFDDDFDEDVDALDEDVDPIDDDGDGADVDEDHDDDGGRDA